MAAAQRRQLQASPPTQRQRAEAFVWGVGARPVVGDLFVANGVTLSQQKVLGAVRGDGDGSPKPGRPVLAQTNCAVRVEEVEVGRHWSYPAMTFWWMR
jgi:hypothetical protein